MPSLQYLMVDGHGDPNSASEHADAIGALYPIAYKIKFASKQELGVTTWSRRWRREVYLSDARKAEAAKLRTILRQPVNVA